MLMMFWQVQRLTREINTLEQRQLEMRQQLSHYQDYASKLGGSSILNVSNLAGLAPEILPRASLFAQYSDQASTMSAMQNLQMMKMMGRVPMTNNPMINMQIEMSAFRQFKEQALQALKRQEAMTFLNQKEKEIQLEINDLEQKLTMRRAELESCKKAASQEAKDSVPTFGL